MSIIPKLQSLHPKTQKQLFILFIGFSFVLMAIFSITEFPLNTEAAPHGIVSFELAGTNIKSAKIIASWDIQAKILAAFFLGLDFLFIPVYIGALMFGLAISTRIVDNRSWPLSHLANFLSWGVILAGILDVIENISLLVLLLDKVDAGWSALAAICAIIKFCLLFLALVFVLYGGIASVVNRF